MYNKIILFLLFSISLFSKELVLEQSYFIDSEKNIEPSGLAIEDGKLFFISDNQDNVIYSLKMENNKCSALTEVKYKLSKANKKDKFSYEGICLDDKGNFLVLSENQYKIIDVKRDGKINMGDSFYEESANMGMFKSDFNGPEGIAYLGNGKVVITSQRDYGKLLEGNYSEGKFTNLKVVKINSKTLDSLEKRQKSTSDVYYQNGKVFLLLKKQNGILVLEKRNEIYVETDFYSYNSAIKDKEYHYLNGNDNGEGLVVTDKNIYVIFDNNKEGRIVDINDTRPFLIKLKRP